MIRLALACVCALLAAAGCSSSTPTPSPLTPVFMLDSGTVSCATESVGVRVAIEHAAARPGYLDCITVTLQADAEGTIWLCEPVRDPPDDICEGPTMELLGPDLDRLEASWHTAPQARWSDPIQLLGRVRFL